MDFSGCTRNKDKVGELLMPLFIQCELSRTEEDDLIFISWIWWEDIDMSVTFIDFLVSASALTGYSTL